MPLKLISLCLSNFLKKGFFSTEQSKGGFETLIFIVHTPCVPDAKNHFELLIGDAKKKNCFFKCKNATVGFGSKEKTFQSKSACHLNFFCFNSLLKQRVKKNDD